MFTNDYIYPNVQNFLYPISKIKGFNTCNTHLFYNPSTHYWISVDDIGAEIISTLESTNSYKETAALLKAKYNIDDQTIKNDVEPYIENLIKYKFYTYEKKDLEIWWQQKDTSSVVKNKYPFNDIYISLTDDCNLRCIYCFNYEKRRARQCDSKKVNVEQLKKVMSQFKNLGGTGVVFTGGEPTLNKSLISLAKFAVELGLSPKLITNGTLLDKIDINEMCSVIKDITVSLDSVNVDELNELWGLPSENALESAIRGLKKIDKYSENDKISLIIAPIVSAVNKNNLEEIVSFAKTELTHCEIKWNFTKFSEIHKKEVDDKLKITDDMLDNALNSALDFPESMSNSKCLFVASNCGKHIPPNAPQFAVCAPSFFITANGDIYPCQGLEKPEYLLGNIANISLEEATESDNFKKLYDRISPNKKESCKNCELRFVCTYKGGICADYEVDKNGNCHDKMIKLMFMQTIVPSMGKNNNAEQK